VTELLDRKLGENDGKLARFFADRERRESARRARETDRQRREEEIRENIEKMVSRIDDLYNKDMIDVLGLVRATEDITRMKNDYSRLTGALEELTEESTKMTASLATLKVVALAIAPAFALISWLLQHIK